MKFTVGQFILWFAIFWMLGIGNWWLCTCNEKELHQWALLGAIVLAIDVVVCIFGLFWILTRKFWDTEINLDKLKKKK